MADGKGCKVLVMDEDGTVIGTYSTADEQAEFDQDEQCIKEGLTLSIEEAVDAVAVQVSECMQRFIK